MVQPPEPSPEPPQPAPQQPDQPDPRGGKLAAWAHGSLWTLLVLLAMAALATGWLPWETPSWLPKAGAVAVTGLYSYGLARRTGGRPLITGGLALVLASAAALSELPVLLAGAAVVTATVAAVLAVMATKAAARFVTVVRECVIATVLAGVGAFAVEAYQAEVSLERIGYLTLGLSLLGCIGLVYRLGAGLHGLGRRGFIMLVSGIGLMVVILAYTEALAHWGSPALIESIDDAIRSIRQTIGAVPRPVAVVVGYPALAWGVSTRARRRQGWWVCAFGAAGFAALTVSLLNPEVSLVETGLVGLYDLILGLLLGYLVVRADKFFTGARGRRARLLEEASAHRPEPGRMQPLL